ncbi:AlpA family phage regulatory protein [Pseudohoeflea suaedae]|uniref:AlpA family phage regulatory protein n=1 Tax=Pseudohoeflea suaedae TaxID=877384 RepID=A0A4V3A7B4_9HYPH|nr:AlpA family phage regulatory protein [Pseudohoeflea suaedae]TDH38105.1 AlpA family phage regulatory protein [Pseudohoeflea suaedae]
MTNRMLPISAVVEATGLSKRTIYEEISHNRFPRPVQLTARRVGWPEERINAWLAQRVSESDAA